MSKVLDFIKEQGWSYEYRGRELETGCPFNGCPNVGESQFYINSVSGAWYCHRCHRKGASVKQLAFQLGLVSKEEPTKVTHLVIPKDDVVKRTQALLNSEEAMSYLTETRGLSKSVLFKYSLGLTTYNSHPVIFLPSFNKEGVCVGGQYDLYLRPDGESKYKMVAGSKSTAYGLDRLKKWEPLLIAEGRYDALTLVQAGYNNVISVPNGVSSIDGWVDEIKGHPAYTIAFDNDRAGEEGARELAKRLGLSKCKRAYSEYKDWSDYLEYGVSLDELRKRIDGAEEMFNAPDCSIAQYQDAVIEAITHPDETKGYSTGWKSFDKRIGGIRPELTVSSGITNDGKTTFAVALIANLIKKGVPCLIASPEMQEPDIVTELVNNYYGEKVSDPEKVKAYVQKFRHLVFVDPVFNSWTNEGGKSKLDHIYDVIEYYVKHKGVKFALLDHLRLFINPSRADDERFMVEEFTKRGVELSQKLGVHIWLVVQYKARDTAFLRSCQKCHKQFWKKLSQDELKGSANIGQDAHNIVLIHRYKDKYCSCFSKMYVPEVEIEVAKVRSTAGTIGCFRMLFDTGSMADYWEVNG